MCWFLTSWRVTTLSISLEVKKIQLAFEDGAASKGSVIGYFSKSSDSYGHSVTLPVLPTLTNDLMRENYLMPFCEQTE